MKLLFVFFAFSIFALSCIKDASYFDIDNLNDGNVTILGHRGMGDLFKYPGNTFEAIIPVIEIGADGTELDVQMTKDSVLILFHNEDMNSRTNCNYEIHEHNWADISICKYSVALPNVRVISVEQLFDSIPNLSELIFSFDCKIPYNYSDKFIRTFARAIKNVSEKYNMENNILVEGKDFFLKILLEEGLKNKLFASGTGNFMKNIEVAKKFNTYGVASDYSKVTKEDVEYAHEQGLRVMLWGGKTRAQSVEMIERNPDIVQSDKPIYLLKIFNQFNYGYNIP